MSRFNPARSSLLSKTSSRIDNDSSIGADNTRNDEDFNDENNSNEFDAESYSNSGALAGVLIVGNNGSNTGSFVRRNSSRFGASKGSLKRSNLLQSQNSRSSVVANTNELKVDESSELHNNSNENKNQDFSNPFESSPFVLNEQNNEDLEQPEIKEDSINQIHIAPLPPFNSTSTPMTRSPRHSSSGSSSTSNGNTRSKMNGSANNINLNNHVINSAILEETVTPSSNKSQAPPPPLPSQNNLANIFTTSLNNYNTKQTNIATNQNDMINDNENNAEEEDFDVAFSRFARPGSNVSSASKTNADQQKSFVKIINKSKNSSVSSGSLVEAKITTESHQNSLGSPLSNTVQNKISNPSASLPSIEDNNLLNSKEANLFDGLASKNDSTWKQPSSPQKTSHSSLSNSKKLNFSNDDDDDQIDWASSEDEEIVKQEIESFEKGKTKNSENSPTTNNTNTLERNQVGHFLNLFVSIYN
jgi:hypothetical protein